MSRNTWNRKCRTKQMKNKQAETEVNVCDRTLRKKTKWDLYTENPNEAALTPKQKKRFQWLKKKQSLTVDDYIKVIFSDESHICIGQGHDPETFVWCRSNETYKDDC